ncbi:MAG TPA: hypothetical protein VFH70_00435 [Acidimicrobiales bacterium]|nr:hypothetical protein [Acidimicrobiales bacterium]
MAVGQSSDSIFFSNFQGGEYGLQGAWVVGWGLYRQHLYYRGYFTGSNVVRYIDGSIGPRSGLVNLGVTGLPVGTVNGLGYQPVPGKSGWVIVGSTLYRFDAETAGSAATSIGALAVAPTRPVTSVQIGQYTYLTNFGDKTYRYDPQAGTLTALTGSPGGSCIAVHQDRLVVGCSSSNGNRIYYSDPASTGDNFGTWPASGYIDVGNQWEVRSLTEQRDHLVITKQDGSYWLLTGTPTVNDTLRLAWGGVGRGSLAMGPIWACRTTLGGDGLVWGIPYGADYPVHFNGVTPADLRFLSFMGGNFADDGAGHVDVGITSGFHADELMVVSGNASAQNAGLLRREGVFTKHAFGANVSGFIASGNTGRMLLTDGGGAAAPVMYAWRPFGVQRPNVVGNNLESVGDGSNTPLSASFAMPEWQERGGGLVTVREVHVDFQKWNTGAAATNHFDLTVTATRRYGTSGNPNPGTKDSATQSFDEAGSAAAAPGASLTGPGTLDTRHFYFGGQGKGGGFILKFANLRGVAIQRIEAIVTIEPSRV